MTAPASSIGEVAQQIAAERGITLSHAYKLARQQETQPPAPAGWPRKDYIVEALRRFNSNVGVNSQTLLRALLEMGQPTNINTLTGDLWDLQKGQWVAFRESHTKRGSQLSMIRLTASGKVRAAGRLANGQGDPHRSSAPRVVTKPRPAPEVFPGPAYEPPKPEAKPAPLPQNMKAFLAESEKEDPLWGYPAIRDLLDRNETHRKAREKAAKIVEAASSISDIDPEGAELLMSRAAEIEGPSLTKLEQEVVMFVEETCEAGGSSVPTSN